MKHRTQAIAMTAAALLAATPVAAQKADAFPGRLVKSDLPKATLQQRAPLNKEAKLGTKVFGATSIDYNRARNFVNYYENRYELEKLNTIFNEAEASIDPTLYMINAGAYNPSDGYYYAYKVKYYTIGITHSYQWLKVNPADGKWEVVAELENKFHNSTPLYDLAYSPYDDEMWGLVRNDDGQTKSRIGIVDMSNSAVTDLIQLDEYYFAMAFDYDGNLHAIRWEYDSDSVVIGTRLDIFDKDFKVAKSLPVLVDGKAFKPYYQHGLDFDYTTGELIWSATDYEGNQNMVRIIPETAETINYGKIGYSETMLALYVPYTTASHREAPAKADGLGFIIDPNGENNVTITWTNPATTWNRKKLDNLTSVRIYRDRHEGTPIGTVDASGKEGTQMSFTDKDAPKGIHKYYVIPVNAKGEGVETYTEAYVGHDVPGQVNDLRVAAKDNGKSVEITWTAPTGGASEGWFDKNMTYDIERLPDHVKVASGLNVMSYTDSDIAESQFYSYIVTPVTSDGRGEPCTSEGILAGGSLKVPFSTEFATAPEAERFLSFDNYGVKSLFQYSNNNTKIGTMAMRYELQANNNATLSSPPMNLTKGKTYRVDWHFTFDRFGQSFEDTYHHLRVMAGTAPNEKEMTTVLADHTDFLSVKRPESFVLTTYFESPVDGDYCVGFNVATNDENRKNDWVYVTGFSISESPADDLAAEKLRTPLILSSSIDNYFDVEVYNNGANSQDKYSVEVGIYGLDGVFEPFASTSEVPEIKSHSSATVRVKGTTDRYGVQDIAARVVLEGDGNSHNDISAYQTAKVEAGVAYNYHADVEETSHMDSGIPMSFYYSNSTVQTIYTAAMLGMEEDQTPIGGLAWEYISSKDISNVHLKVYLTTTDKDTYNTNRPAFITDGNKLVFDGNVNIRKDEGDNIYKWMDIPFSENYVVPAGKNLAVTVFMEETASNGDFPTLFKVFNSPNAGPDTSDNLTHTLTARDSQGFNLANPGKILTYKELPTIHLGVSGNREGVDGISSDASGMDAEIRSGSIRFIGNVAYASVYDMAGRMLRAAAVGAGTAMPLNLCNGVYILQMQDTAGNLKTMKFVIR